MTSGKKQTIIITLGVAFGILLAAAIGYLIKIAIIASAAKALDAEIEKARIERIREKTATIQAQTEKIRQEKIYQKENSNECRFWRQQLETNKNAIKNIYKYCYYGPEHKEIPHPNSNKIWKTGE